MPRPMGTCRRAARFRQGRGAAPRTGAARRRRDHGCRCLLVPLFTGAATRRAPEVTEVTDAAGPPGPLIGSGRAADVYAVDGGRVLRRYRTAHSCAAEADLMRYLREAGYPVPEVFAVAGPDLVMERLSGRDMLADLASRPWRVARHARTLARLHNQLHQVAAPPGLRQPLGPGGQVVHLDLHPGNVMLTAGGPVVIDWSGGCAGPAGAAVADDPAPHLARAAELRLNDLNVRPAEAARLRRLAGQAAAERPQ